MDIREKFLKYFEDREHLILRSASLVPEDDPSVLLTTAGMQPFKPYYLGVKKPPKTRIATVQKCFRTSDIDSVGYTERHLTFFEMLGNFSFGDYFKKEAIHYALDFVVNHLGLDIENLWVAVFKGGAALPRDEEALRYWVDEGIPRERIVELGKSENFWGPAGETGPCGPCTEIYYDYGPDYGCKSKQCNPSCDCGRFLEIWNLVFTQYNFNGTDYVELPSKNIDTGMGLERIAAVLEGKSSVFDTKLFKKIITRTEELAEKGNHDLSEVEYKRAIRVIADHSRAIYFLISDGVIPANESRGYILRRIIRRAVRFGKLLGIKKHFLNQLGEILISEYGKSYPRLTEKKEFAFKMVNDEEERFSKTLKQGSKVLMSAIEALKSSKNDYINPRDAFRLYDTYGFPVELTREILQENNLRLDMDKFNHYLKQHVVRSKEKTTFDKKIDQKIDLYRELAKTHPVEFVGYQKLNFSTRIIQILRQQSGDKFMPVDELKPGQAGEVLLKATPFYAEKGGQIGDKGRIFAEGSMFEVKDTQVPVEGIYVHKGRVKEGTLTTGDEVEAEVDVSFRKDISKNHTATHLLHWALRTVLGQEVNQSGSYVDRDRFRFDFISYQTPKKEDLERIELLINAKIQNNDLVKVFETTQDYAREIGAIALFDEKYGDFVRVVEIDNYSRELCGGTHVRRTGELGLFKIISEGSIGANTRRIEAVTGFHALNLLNRKAELTLGISRTLGVEEAEIINELENLKNNYEQAKTQLETLNIRMARDQILSEFNYSPQDKKLKILYYNLSNSSNGPELDADSLAAVGDQIKDLYHQKSTAVILGNVFDKKPVLLIQATHDLVKGGLHCGKIARDAGKILGGGGGGKPDFAQSGGSKPEKLDEAINLAKTRIEEK
ncbi:MAG: alanine--tRNA ligase [Actinomycetia bacterium]|nr:alanine--tRNA ligase [Actinomycetes bacterium]